MPQRSVDTHEPNDILAEVVADNPHCSQLQALLATPFLPMSLSHRTLNESDRFLSPNWPRIPYLWRLDADRSSCHWGQLKLFESELRCLTDSLICSGISLEEARNGVFSKHPRRLVIYAGAAPGRHIPSLVRRFPNFHFEMYDPAKFDDRVLQFSKSQEAGGRVKIFQGFFDEKCAQAIAKRRGKGKVVFISDIRSADLKAMQHDKVENAIVRDMARQKTWVRTMRPALSLLKFRLPWVPGVTRYLPGRLLVQAFAPCTSTETWLVVARSDLDRDDVVYEHREYSEQLMYHNTVNRASLHDLGLTPTHRAAIPGLDECFDCAALVSTVRRYMAVAHGVRAASEVRVVAELKAIFEEITQSGRTLDTRYHVSSSRHSGRFFAAKRYIDASGCDNLSVLKPSKKSRCGAEDLNVEREEE